MDLHELADNLLSQLNELGAERSEAFRQINRENAKLRYRTQFLSKYGSVSYGDRPDIHKIVNQMNLDPDPAALEKAKEEYLWADLRYKEVANRYETVMAQIKGAQKARDRKARK